MTTAPAGDDRLAATPAACPLTVVGPAGPCVVVVELAGPEPWSVVGPPVLAAAGLAPTTTVWAGVEVLTADHRVGLPPLVAGAVLSPSPTLPDDPPTGLVVDVVAGPDAGGSVAAGGPLTVGRSPRAELTVADPLLSHRHARLEPMAGGVLVTDLTSTNGTAAAGGAVTTRAAPVGLGEVVRVGDSLLRVELAATVPLLARDDGRGHRVLTLPPVPPAGPVAEAPAPPAPPPAPPPRGALPWWTSGLGLLAGAAVAAVTGQWVFLLLALTGPITLLGSAVGDRRSDARRDRAARRDHRLAAEQHAAALDELVRADHARSWASWADPARLLRAARTGGSGLWSVQPGDDLPVVLSVGTRPTRCAGAPELVTPDVPLPVPLPRTGVVGVVAGRRAAVRWLLAQLVGTVAPDRLQLAVLSDDPALDALAVVPHLAGGPRLPARGPRELGEQLSSAAAGPDGCLVAVVDDAARWHDHPDLTSLAARTDLLLVLLARRAEHLPRRCTAVIDLDALPGRTIGVSAGYLDGLCAALAPLTVPGAARASAVALAAPDVATTQQRWARAGPAVATIGLGPGGPVAIDLDRDGPHLLVAGTTGAGKSELLLTLVCSLAVELPPDRLSVLAVDYKGGTAFAALRGLPHCCGTITDLDAETSRRALRSLRAEIRRRERHQASGGAPAGSPGAPARLLVVVDEFATLAAELPDFLDGLVDIAQRGRSLGVHLVLATQRPAGVVTAAIRANTGARVCLRVTDPADSIDVVGVPDAARLPAARPGSAVLLRPGAAAELLTVAAVSRPPPVLPRVRGLHPGGTGPPPATGPTGAGPAARVAVARAVAERLGVRAAPAPWLPPPTTDPDPDPAVLGRLDRVDEQRIEAWRLPAGAVLVSGPPRSGRTTAARRWAAAALAAGDRLVVLDAGGDLGALGTTTGVEAVLRPAEAPRALAALRHLVERVREGRVEGTALLVDGTDDWTSALERLDPFGAGELLGALVDLGPGRGVRSLLTAGIRPLRCTAGCRTVVRLGGVDRFGDVRPGTPPGVGTLTGDLAPDGVTVHLVRPPGSVGERRHTDPGGQTGMSCSADR